CLSPSPAWLNRPLLLPHWNYIPHNSTRQNQEDEGGYMELIGSPVLLWNGSEQGLAVDAGGGVELSRVVSIRDAATLLHNRYSRKTGQRVSVSGCVSSVCPLLVVRGITFFIFTLMDDTHTLPVLVKDSSKLWWSECVCVGQCVCVTALRVCVLRSWKANRILCVTDRSVIHTQDSTHNTHAPDTHTDTQSDMSLLLSHNDEDVEEVEPQRDIIQSAMRIKESRVISYQ
ncbi:hypothetical protein LDENG_00264230, partial [Lucifuga dentata]